MSTHELLAVLAGSAFVLSLIALGLAVALMRQSGRALAAIRKHRTAHNRTHGTPDPDRRRHNAGPPAGKGERRRDQQHIDDRDPEPVGPPALVTSWRDLTLAAARAEQQLPAEPTQELAQPDLPTRQARHAQPYTPPPVPNPARRRSDLA